MFTKKAIAACAIAALAMLTGCGGNNADNGGGSGNNAAMQEQQAFNGQDGRGQMNRMGFDLMGKIKSVDGQTITVYKSAFVPGGQGGPGGRGGGSEGNPPSGDAPPQGSWQPGDELPEGEMPSPGDGQQSGNGGSRNRMNMENMFTDETADIIVTDNTKIIKTEFVDNQRQETEIGIGDLQADDIITVDLEDGTQQALTITIGSGFGGGGFGMGGGGERPQGRTAPQNQQQGQ